VKLLDLVAQSLLEASKDGRPPNLVQYMEQII